VYEALVHVAMLLPAAIRRAFQIMKVRVLGVFAETPVLFFGVVIGVAVVFRLGVGVVREARTPPVVVPTFATGPEPGLAATTTATATATAVPSVEVGAAARVQPFGSPQPARVAPRPAPRHGRKPVR
jgi:hypothetical protein